jgi:hypothetical protein
MSGGQTHLDTWDPKPGTETGGPTKAIKTSADGVQLAENLPLTAQQMHHGTIIRSLTSTQGAHEQGNYMMHTSYELRGTIRHPGMGAWLNVFQGGGNSTLPKYVYIGNDSRHPGAGFFPAARARSSSTTPRPASRTSKLQPGLTEDKFNARLKLADELDADFRSTFPHRNVKAYADMYDDAIAMMKSEDLKAFDLTEEAARSARRLWPRGLRPGLPARPPPRRARRALCRGLPRRLGHPQRQLRRVPELCETLDKGLSTLLSDLHNRGLLKDTLVVLTTEFGRTPDINQNVGRDHYPKAFSAAMFGGGIKAAAMSMARPMPKAARSSPTRSRSRTSTPPSPMPSACRSTRCIYSPSKRPFTIADKGQPLTSVSSPDPPDGRPFARFLRRRLGHGSGKP